MSWDAIHIENASLQTFLVRFTRTFAHHLSIVLRNKEGVLHLLVGIRSNCAETSKYFIPSIKATTKPFQSPIKIVPLHVFTFQFDWAMTALWKTYFQHLCWEFIFARENLSRLCLVIFSVIKCVKEHPSQLSM